jgi:hypothetical protein
MKLIQCEARLVVAEAKELEALREKNDKLLAEIETLRQTVTSGTSKAGLVKRAKKNAKKFWKTIACKAVKKETNAWETIEKAGWFRRNDFHGLRRHQSGLSIPSGSRASSEWVEITVYQPRRAGPRV